MKKLTTITNTKNQWAVKYKSPSTGNYITEIFDDMEDVCDFVENVGAFCEIQQIFD